MMANGKPRKRRQIAASRFSEGRPAVKFRVRILTTMACVINTGECARVKRPSKFTWVNSRARGRLTRTHEPVPVVPSRAACGSGHWSGAHLSIASSCFED
jgi:hypothetical protein